MLAMIHDFGQDDETAAVIRKELKMEPAEFDKQFIASVDGRNQNHGGWFRPVAEGHEAGRRTGRQEGLRRGDQRGHAPFAICIPTTSRPAASTSFWPKLTWPKAIKRPPSTSWNAMCTSRRAQSGYHQATGRRSGRRRAQEGSRRVLDRLNYIYPMDADCTRGSATLWLDAGNAAGAIREFRAVVARDPLDPAQRTTTWRAPTRLNQPARRGQGRSCWPRWKPRPDSGRRRSCCWN